MKVLFLTLGGVGTASSRARVYDYLPFLRASAVDAEVLQAPRGRRYLTPRLWKGLLSADVVFVQKALLALPLRFILRGLRKPCVYDMDDALFAVPEYIVPASRTRNRMKRRADRMLAWADAVAVANDYLARYAAPRSKRVALLEMAVDCDRFYPQFDRRTQQRPPVLGWVGAADGRHFDNVRLLVEPIRRVAAERPVELRLIGLRNEDRFVDLFRDIPGLTVQTVGWKPDASHVPAEIRALDVGLAPLADDPFTRGKSPIKLLEYMASGVVVVASRVGTQPEVIRDGFNGFLAASSDEWVTRLQNALAAGPETEALRRNAVSTVRERYSINVRGPELVQLLRDCALRRTDGRPASRRPD